MLYLAQLQPALHAQVAWAIGTGLWLHLASVWQYPRLGNACAWQLSADQTPAYALAQDWPCCTESLPQPCIYGLSPRLGLKLELLRLSIGFESLELGLKAQP